jgi:hypothetical protein
MPLSEEVHECLACEAKFKQSDAILAGVAIIFSSQYCSKECQENFEQCLELESKLATERALATAETQEAVIRKVVSGFNLKINTGSK